MTPAARIVLARLAATDAAAVADCLVPPVRQYLRDAMIRVAFARFYAGQPRTAAARAMAADLAAGASGGTPALDALAAILALNDGNPIRWRRLLEIAGPISKVQ